MELTPSFLEKLTIKPFSDSNFSNEKKLTRINLDLKVRFLITESEFVKCHECNAPVTK